METNEAAVKMIEDGEWCRPKADSECMYRWNREGHMFECRIPGGDWWGCNLPNSSDWRVVQKCRECKGTGKVDTGRNVNRCEICKGKGIEPEAPEPESECDNCADFHAGGDRLLVVKPSRPGDGVAICPFCGVAVVRPKPEPGPAGEFEEWEAGVDVDLSFHKPGDPGWQWHSLAAVQAMRNRFLRFKFERKGEVAYSTTAPMLWCTACDVPYRILEAKHERAHPCETIYPVAAIMRTEKPCTNDR